MITDSNTFDELEAFWAERCQVISWLSVAPKPPDRKVKDWSIPPVTTPVAPPRSDGPSGLRKFYAAWRASYPSGLTTLGLEGNPPSSPPGLDQPAQPPPEIPGSQLFPCNIEKIDLLQHADPIEGRGLLPLWLVRKKGIPASKLSAAEKAEWRDLITRQYQVSSESYVFLCYFPSIPDLTPLPHQFNQSTLEMQYALHETVSAAHQLRRLLVVQDLTTGCLVQVAQPLKINITVFPAS